MYTEINNLREQIKSLNCYKKFSPVQQKIVMSTNNVKSLIHSLNVIKNIGFDKWDQQTKAMYLNQIVINEIKNNG